jgi:hypothetical protein
VGYAPTAREKAPANAGASPAEQLRTPHNPKNGVLFPRNNFRQRYSANAAERITIIQSDANAAAATAKYKGL